MLVETDHSSVGDHFGKKNNGRNREEGMEQAEEEEEAEEGEKGEEGDEGEEINGRRHAQQVSRVHGSCICVLLQCTHVGKTARRINSASSATSHIIVFYIPQMMFTENN